MHDEYRGFHHILPGAAPGDYRWVSTDPVDVKDVFIWDTSTDGKYWTASTSILQARTGPAMAYRKVDGCLSNPVTPGNFRDGVFRFNRSGRYFNVRGFAVPIGDDPSVNLIPTGCVLGNSGRIGMVSSTLTSTPVRIDESAFSRCAGSFPADVLRAEAVAHEVSHKLDLEHCRRSVGLVTSPTPLTSLTLGQYSVDPANPSAIHIRLKIYRDGLGASQLAERINTSLASVPSEVFLNPVIGYSAVGTIPPAARNPIIQVLFTSPVATPVGRISVDTQQLRIMDYGIRIDQPVPNPAGEPDLRSFAGWDFFPIDLEDLEDTCLVCPQRIP